MLSTVIRSYSMSTHLTLITPSPTLVKVRGTGRSPVAVQFIARLNDPSKENLNHLYIYESWFPCMYHWEDSEQCQTRGRPTSQFIGWVKR